MHSHTYINTYIHIYIQTCIHTCIHYIHKYKHEEEAAPGQWHPWERNVSNFIFSALAYEGGYTKYSPLLFHLPTDSVRSEDSLHRVLGGPDGREISNQVSSLPRI